MSLTNNLINKPTINAYGRKIYKVKLADLVKGGAFTTVDILLDTFPGGTVFGSSNIKHTVAVAGTSFSAATARLKVVTAAASPITTYLTPSALDAFAAVGVLDGTSSVPSGGYSGTFTLNGATPVTVANANVAITDVIPISLNTVGGTVGVQPHIATITGGTGFTVVGTASDTSIYNYSLGKATSGVAGDLEADNYLYMTVTSTGGNLSAATAGEIHAWVNTSGSPFGE